MLDELKKSFEKNDVKRSREIIDELSLNNQFTEDHLPYLASGLNSTNTPLVDTCINALLYLPQELRPLAAKELSELIEAGNMTSRNAAGDILRNYDNDSLDVLIELMGSNDFDVRKFACDIIGLIGDVSCENFVIPLLDDEDTNVRTSAVETLGNIKSQTAISHLIDLFKKEEELQNNIIDSLGKIGGIDSEYFLMDLYENNDDEFIKLLAIEALAHCGSNMDIVHEIVEHMGDFNEEVQKIILKTVTAIPYRLNVPYKIPEKYRKVAHLALEDDDEDLKLSGMIALGNDLNEKDVSSLVKLAMQNNENINQLMLINLIEANKDDLLEQFIVSLIEGATPETIVNMAVTASFLFNEANMPKMNKFMEITVEKARELNPTILSELDISEEN